MSSIVFKLIDQNVLQAPSYVKNTHYEVITGSYAYNVSQDTSDIDIYGWCIPNKEIVFPHLQGKIANFDETFERFDQLQRHHINWNAKEYDVTIFNIVKYFQLCMDNNPNMIDTLYVPEHCVIHSSDIGRKVRLHRSWFLHKGCFHKLRGYAFSQLKKAKEKNPEGKRKAIVDKYGFDVKFASHVVRLSDECEQLLTQGDMDVTRSCEMQKAIRRGEMPLADIEKWFHAKELELEKLYHNTTALPYSPDVDRLRTLLLECLEDWYGSIDHMVEKKTNADKTLSQIKSMLDQYYS